MPPQDDSPSISYLRFEANGEAVTSKRGEANDVVKVIVFDDTGEATLSLWRSMADSAQNWTAGHTILLITNPGWRIDKCIWLSVTSNTMFDIDPEVSDAFWLRNFAQRMTKREHTNFPFLMGGRERKPFTLD